MSRKPTIVYDGAIYHIIQRGNNRAHIYNDQLDKAKFCDLLKETMDMEDYGFSLLYYVLMDNHYHLIIETPEASIDRIMHRVNMLYTKYYNKKYGRKGVLYEGRYTGLLILENSYLQSVIRYIAYNPVRAGLVKTPAEYRWCAHLDIVATKHGLVDVAGLLSKFDQDPVKAKAAYTLLISGEMPVQKNQRQVQDKKVQKRMTNLEAMLFSEIKDEAIRKLVCQRDKTALISAHRQQFAERAYLAGFYVKEIATLLNMTPRAVHYMLEGTRAKPKLMRGME